MTMTEHLNLQNGGIVAVVGCGGKTSVINLLAMQNSKKRVLVSPTTHMFPLWNEDIVLLASLEECIAYMPRAGVTCMGLLNAQSGKLHALPKPILREIATRFDLALLEADGSRALPLKGWRQDEPVVPEFCTHTIGVLGAKALCGQQVLEDTVLRPELFCKLTGLGMGETVTQEALVKMLCDSEGMFRRSSGKRFVVINQVEDVCTVKKARSLLREIGSRYVAQFDGLLYGSALQNVWYAEPLTDGV